MASIALDIAITTEQPYVSKSMFLRGHQCKKLLWYSYNAKDQIPESDTAQQAIFDRGHEVGALAKQLFPNGIEVGQGVTDLDETIRLTKQALKLHRPLFEAAFAANGGYCRVDILKPVVDGAWDLIEVKSTTAAKDIHLPDLAFQTWVLANSGLKIRRCFLMHINGDNVRQGPVDPKKFFTQVNVTKRVSGLSREIQSQLEDMHRTIQYEQEPEIKIGPHCSDPYACPLMDKCWSFLPSPNVFDLYYAGKKRWRLFNDGIVRLDEIPDHVDLTERQTIQHTVALTGQPHIDRKALARFLKRLKCPVSYLDFETFSTAIPLFDGLKPYQQVPFQFSLHRQSAPGAKPEHDSSLAEGKVDPRPEFLNRLRDCIADKGTVVVYNAAFEKAVLGKLAQAFPAHAGWIANVKRRIIDLLKPFQNFNYYHPEQAGSASIKSVLPVLTGRSYANLEIQEGGQASMEFMRVHFGDVPEDERRKVRQQLERYCGQDTEGMLWIVDELKKLVP